jgi:hypothetical protein
MVGRFFETERTEQYRGCLPYLFRAQPAIEEQAYLPPRQLDIGPGLTRRVKDRRKSVNGRPVKRQGFKPGEGSQLEEGGGVAGAFHFSLRQPLQIEGVDQVRRLVEVTNRQPG